MKNVLFVLTKEKEEDFSASFLHTVFFTPKKKCEYKDEMEMCRREKK